MCVIERMLEGYFFGGLVDPLKTLPIVGRFFARAARVLDRYVGWLARTIWARTLKIDDKKIVFITFSKMYNCNPKYICEELIHRGSDYHLVWLTGSEQAMDGNTFPDCVKQVQIGTVASFWEILTAKVIVQNAYLSQELGYLPKQKGQYYIQTWHGSLGIKQFGPGYDSIKRRVRAAERAGRLNDLFLSNSRFETEEVAPVFWSGSEVCQWGHARNDILITNDPLKAAAVREHLRIPQGCKVALYAPTYRDQSSMEHYISDYDQLESALSERFGGDWIILVKLHFACRKYADDVRSGKNVINASGYADIQELMLVADVGITDYSSWIFDYMLLLLPVEPMGIAGKVQLFVIELAAADFAAGVDFQNLSCVNPHWFPFPEIQAGIFQPFSQDFLRAGVDVQAALGEVVDGQRVVSLHEVEFVLICQDGDGECTFQFLRHISKGIEIDLTILFQKLHSHIAVRLHFGGGQFVLFEEGFVIGQDTVMGQGKMRLTSHAGKGMIVDVYQF